MPIKPLFPKFTNLQSCILELAGCFMGIGLTLYARRFYGEGLAGVAAFLTLMCAMAAQGYLVQHLNSQEAKRSINAAYGRTFQNSDEQKWAKMLEKKQ